jgi:hypothetical protein
MHCVRSVTSRCVCSDRSVRTSEQAKAAKISVLLFQWLSGCHCEGHCLRYVTYRTVLRDEF